jgi:hypothetical protein
MARTDENANTTRFSRLRHNRGAAIVVGRFRISFTATLTFSGVSS